VPPRLATFAEAFSSIGWAATAARTGYPGHCYRERPDDGGHSVDDMEDELAAGMKLEGNNVHL
jgi:hypothetical protein